VQAAMSALHAQAPTAEATDWRQIAALYGTLAAMSPSIVVEVNRDDQFRSVVESAMPETEYLLHPIGFIRSYLQDREQAPKQGSEGAPDAWLEVNSAVAEGLEGIEVGIEAIDRTPVLDLKPVLPQSTDS
jgi:hypothetical protein